MIAVATLTTKSPVPRACLPDHVVSRRMTLVRTIPAVVEGFLVVSVGDGAPLFAAVEAGFDDIAVFVEVRLEAWGRPPVRPRRRRLAGERSNVHPVTHLNMAAAAGSEPTFHPRSHPYASRQDPVLNRPGFRIFFRSWEGWRDARQEL